MRVSVLSTVSVSALFLFLFQHCPGSPVGLSLLIHPTQTFLLAAPLVLPSLSVLIHLSTISASSLNLLCPKAALRGVFSAQAHSGASVSSSPLGTLP